MDSALYGETEQLTKIMHFEYFQIDRFQNAKCMQSTLYGERKRNFQKRVFQVFISLLSTKTLKKKHGKHW